MGLPIGLLTGVGLVLIWLACTAPASTRVDRTSARAGRSAELLARAGLPQTTPAGLAGVCLACGVTAGLVVQVLSRTPTVAAAFGLLAAYLPVALLAGRARRRHRELLEAWPDAVDNLASAVRAGLSLAEALAGLGKRGPEALRPHFEAFAVDYQLTGRFGDSLDRLKERLADPVGDRVIEGLRIARDVGGGELGGVLRNLSGFLRDDARARSELEARQAWSVMGARLAVAAPWLVLLMLSFQREVITRYSSPQGAMVLAVGGGVTVAAYRLMVRIGRLPVEQRVLS